MGIYASITKNHIPPKRLCEHANKAILLSHRAQPMIMSSMANRLLVDRMKCNFKKSQVKPALNMSGNKKLNGLDEGTNRGSEPSL